MRFLLSLKKTLESLQGDIAHLRNQIKTLELRHAALVDKLAPKPTEMKASKLNPPKKKVK